MNICIITASFMPEAIGSSLQLYHMCGLFSRLGHSVLLLCPDYALEPVIYPDSGCYQGEIYPQVLVRPVPSRRNPLRPALLKFADHRQWKLEELIGDFSPDIIHVEDPDRIYGLKLYGMDQTFAYGTRIAIDFAKSRGIPAIAYHTANYPEFSKQAKPEHVFSPYLNDTVGVYQAIYGEYDQVLCSSEDSRKHLERHGILNARCGKFIGINEAVFDSGLKHERVTQSDSVKILYAGRFDAGKDIRIVLDIWKEAASRDGNIELYLAGGGKETVNNWVRAEAGQDTRITYLGFLSQHELVKVFNSVDIYFSPHASDTFGLSIIEAMYRGLPVVVDDRGGPASFVQSEKNGYVCATREDYVRGLRALCADKSLRKALGERSRALAAAFKGEACARRLVDAYQEIIRGAGSHGIGRAGG